MANNLIDKTQEQLIKYTKKYYKIAHGKNLDLDNPVFFTEKEQWYTFFYKNPLCSYIVDKVTFKTYIEEKLGPGHTIPMYAHWDNIQDFEKSRISSELPKEFCLKANLQSDGRCIKIIHDKDAVDFEALKKEVAEWLKPENTNINSLARNFYMSKPQILAEAFMANFQEQLYDYKFYCFNGTVHCVYVAQDHFGKDGSHISFYDLDWNKLKVQYGNHIVGDAPRPKHFALMKEYAHMLSKDFPFVRVDFFDTDEQLYLAELTFNPGGGFTPYHPEEFNKEMGDLFQLPK